MDNVKNEKQIAPIMLRAGLVYSEKSNLTEVMCKPKILPLKSNTLQKLEKMEQEMQKQQRIATAAGGLPQSSSGSMGGGIPQV